MGGRPLLNPIFYVLNPDRKGGGWADTRNKILGEGGFELQEVNSCELDRIQRKCKFAVIRIVNTPFFQSQY